MATRQLLYISLATRDFSDAELSVLLEEARLANFEHNVTGLLLYVERLFIQCIEGEQKTVSQLAKNIQNDGCHTDFTLRLDKSVEAPSFSNWSMGFHAQTLSDLQKTEGFHDIRSIRDFEAIKHKSDLIITIMKDFYKRNSRYKNR
jgi:hypothetical protein